MVWGVCDFTLDNLAYSSLNVKLIFECDNILHKKVIYIIDIHHIELRVKRWIYQMPNCQGAVEGYEYQILRINNNQCGFRWLARRMWCECCLFI